MRPLLCAVLALAACADDGLGVVPPTGAVDGWVCDPDTGGLAVGARVAARGPRGETATLTDAHGYFLLTGLSVGAATLSLSGNGWAFTLGVTVVEGQTTRLPNPSCLPSGRGSVRGRICATEAGVGSGTGYWLVGAAVSITVGPDVYTATTDATGHFVLSDVPAGSHTLEVAKGSFTAVLSVSVADGETTEIDHVCLAPTRRFAVVTGLFDRIEDVLTDLGFAVSECVPAGMPGCPASLDPTGRMTLVDGSGSDYITDFLLDPVRLDAADVIFLNCGLADAYLTSAPPNAIAALRDFVSGGGSIYVSDWAYEALRLTFGGRFDFFGNDALAQSARLGAPDTSLTATIVEPRLAAALGGSAVSLVYNKSDWVVLDPRQASDVVVWVRGNPGLDTTGDGVADTTLSDTPLLVSASYGAGRIVYTTFHTHQQASADMLAILRYIVFEL